MKKGDMFFFQTNMYHYLCLSPGKNCVILEAHDEWQIVYYRGRIYFDTIPDFWEDVEGNFHPIEPI